MYTSPYQQPLNNIMMYNPNPMATAMNLQYQPQQQNHPFPQLWNPLLASLQNAMNQQPRHYIPSQLPSNIYPPANNNMLTDATSLAYRLLFSMYQCKLMNPSGNCILDPNTLTVIPEPHESIKASPKPNHNIKVNINYIQAPTASPTTSTQPQTNTATNSANTRPLVTPSPTVSITPAPITQASVTNNSPTGIPTESPTTQAIQSTGSVFTYDQKKFIVDEHNKYRSEIALGKYASFGHPKAAKMHRIHWDAALEKVAQSWANTCNEGHTPAAVNMEEYCEALGVIDCHQHYDDIVWINGVGYHKYLEGQNMWGGGGDKQLDWAVRSATRAWFDEYDDPVDQQGHFTQVTNDQTTKVGCGYAYCPHNGIHNLFFCNYYLPNGKYTAAQTNTGEDCPGGSDTSTGLCV